MANYYDVKENNGSKLAVDNLTTKVHIYWLLSILAKKFIQSDNVMQITSKSKQ